MRTGERMCQSFVVRSALRISEGAHIAAVAAASGRCRANTPA